jgi:hypothetical protein
VLGRALHTDAKYAEVTFPSTTMSTAAAASLPTPATAAATTYAAAFAGCLTTAASAGLHAAAAVSAVRVAPNTVNDAGCCYCHHRPSYSY